MKNILMLGGQGYIGSSLTDYLGQSGYQVQSVDLCWFTKNTLGNNTRADYSSLAQSFIDDFHAIILLAGHSSVRMCQADIRASLRNNVTNFVDLLCKIDKQKLIYASSASVYGNTGGIPVRETHPCSKALTAYDLQKQEIDEYARLSGKEVYGLRFGTVCGGSTNLRTDLLVNNMVDCALTENVIPVSQEMVYRPVLGLRDLCRAIEAILSGPERPGIYNIASGNYVTQAVANITAALLGGVHVEPRVMTTSYSMGMCTSRFQEAFTFNFEDNIDAIVDTIVKVHGTAHKSSRDQTIEYHSSDNRHLYCNT